MGRDVRRFRDAYGQRAVLVPNSHDNGWKLTLFNKQGMRPYTRACRSFASAKQVLAANGYSWTEV